MFGVLFLGVADSHSRGTRISAGDLSRRTYFPRAPVAIGEPGNCITSFRCIFKLGFLVVLTAHFLSPVLLGP